MNKNTSFVSWCVLLVLSAYYAISHINLETNILKLLPKYDSEITSTIIDKATNEINDKLIITVANTSKKQALQSFKNILLKLNKSNLFKQVKAQTNLGEYKELYQQLHKYRYLLLSKHDSSTLNDKQVNTNEYFVDMAKAQLFGPTGSSLKQIKTDPLFLFNNIINQLSAFNNQDIQNDDGFFYNEKNGLHYFFAFAQLQGSSYSPQYQLEISQLIESSKQSVTSQKSHFYAFGSILYAHDAYKQAKGEISTVGLGSLIGIFILFLITFRSLLPLIISITSIGLGLIFAFAVTLFVFNKVHVFALVFGSTIAGVSIDYCFHYLCESSVSSSKKTLKNILPGLLIGFASSAMVYVGFIITGYAVLAQISLFSIVGLFAVLLNVILLFPKFVTTRPINSSHIMLKAANKLVNNPISPLVNSVNKVLVFFAIVLAMNIMFLKPNDNVRALQSLSGTLKADENIIRDVMSLKANGRYALIYANTIDELLDKETNVLHQLKGQGLSIYGVSDFIPPLTIQKRNHSFYQQIYHSDEFQNYINSIGIDSSTIPFQQFESSKKIQISNEIFENQGIKNILKQRWLGKVKNVYALIVPLTNDSTLLTDNQVIIVQQAEDASKLFAGFRVKSQFIVLISALVLILMLAFNRYGIKKSLHLVLIPLSAGLLSLLLTQAFGFHISLFSILALLLVLGMGLDYVVFLVEAKNPSHVTFALLLSSITTILSFGLLSLSSVAVIKSFGMSVAIGILLILFLSPAIISKKEK